MMMYKKYLLALLLIVAHVAQVNASATNNKMLAKVPAVPAEIDAKESWFGIQDGVYFYKKGELYEEFSNFHEAVIELDGKVWPRSEHYFQAQKFPKDPALQEKIRTEASARKIFAIAREKKPERRGDWNKIKKAVMIRAVQAKVEQHDDIKELLLATKKRVIVENAGKKDAWWGAGSDGTGQNMLGRVLMYVRSGLQGAPDNELLEKHVEAFKK